MNVIKKTFCAVVVSTPLILTLSGVQAAQVVTETSVDVKSFTQDSVKVLKTDTLKYLDSQHKTKTYLSFGPFEVGRKYRDLAELNLGTSANIVCDPFFVEPKMKGVLSSYKNFFENKIQALFTKYTATSCRTSHELSNGMRFMVDFVMTQSTVAHGQHGNQFGGHIVHLRAELFNPEAYTSDLVTQVVKNNFESKGLILAESILTRVKKTEVFNAKVKATFVGMSEPEFIEWRDRCKEYKKLKARNKLVIDSDFERICGRVEFIDSKPDSKVTFTAASRRSIYSKENQHLMAEVIHEFVEDDKSNKSLALEYSDLPLLLLTVNKLDSSLAGEDQGGQDNTKGNNKASAPANF